MRFGEVMEIIVKGWGREEVVVNRDDYCGKVLRINAGKRCSWHYHNVKHETFLVTRGRLLLKYAYPGHDDLNKANEKVLKQGDVVEIPRGLRHQLIALDGIDVELIEFSSHHEDKDSIRLVKGD